MGIADATTERTLADREEMDRVAYLRQVDFDAVRDTPEFHAWLEQMAAKSLITTRTTVRKVRKEGLREYHNKREK